MAQAICDRPHVAPLPIRKTIKEAYDHSDPDGSGYIDTERLEVVMRAMGFEMVKEEIQSLRSYDEDPSDEGIGTIGYGDFLEMMAHKILPGEF